MSTSNKFRKKLNNEDLFTAEWKLNEFQNLVEYGLDIGSKYFFLVGGGHGLYLMVRDTDSEGLDSKPKRFPKDVFEIFAEGFERELSVEELHNKVGDLYEGDICLWFRLSEQLLADVKNKIDIGYSKLRMLSNPLVLEREHQNPNQPSGFMVHNVAIFAGGSCPIDVFNANINFQYTNKSRCLDIQKVFEDKDLFVDKDEAKIIKFYIKEETELNDKEDYFNIRTSFINKHRFVEAVNYTLLLENEVEEEFKFTYYSQLAQLHLYAEDHISSLECNLEALKYEPNNLPILANTANRLRDIGNLKEAGEYYNRALNIDGKDEILKHNIEKMRSIHFLKLVDAYSFHEALEYHFSIRKYGGFYHTKCDYNGPTEKIIEGLLDMALFENEDEEDFLSFLKSLYSNTSIADSCQEFIRKYLEECLKNGSLEEKWSIGSDDNSLYKNINYFLSEVDFDKICFLINRAWSDACDQGRMEFINQ